MKVLSFNANLFLLAVVAASVPANGSAAPQGASAATPSREIVISGNQSLEIPQSELAGLQSQALAGSGRAAHRVASFYFFTKGDRASGMYWETIAAEDGNAIAMDALSDRLRAEGTAQSTARARFWAAQASAAGFSRSRKLRELMDYSKRR